MAKYIIILLLFFGCYTPKKAENSINKAQTYFPEVVAKKSNQFYPCKPIIQGTDSTAYKEWQQQIKELEDFYNSIEPEYVTDTLNIVRVDTFNRVVAKEVLKVITKLKDAPIIHDTVTITNNAELAVLRAANEKQGKSIDNYKKYLLWALIALIISLLYQIVSKLFRK